MATFGIFGQESRSNTQIDAQSVTISSTSSGSEWKAFFGIDDVEVGEITPQKAMEITSVYSAVNFIADQFASLPCHVYRNLPKGAGTEKAEADPLHAMMSGVVNDNFLTSFQWRKAMAISVLLNGRAYSHIERDGAGRERNLRPLEFDKIEPRLRGGRLEYVETRLDGSKAVHPAADIIDLNPNPKMDGVSHYNPVYQNRHTLKLMLAAEKFTANTFNNGGVPPLQLVSTVASSPQATERAGNKVFDALKNAVAMKRNVLPLPDGYELKPIGLDPAKLQLLDLRRWMVSETARIFRLPKFFLNDTDGGTLANVESQASSLVKNTLTPMLIAPFEGEMSAKCGKRNTYVRLNLNAFVRGAFRDQLEGLRTAVHGSIFTPNEARGYMELPPVEEGDKLMIQGATIALEDAGKHLNQPAPATPEEPDANNADSDPTE